MKKLLTITLLSIATLAMAADTDTISCGDIRTKKVTSGLHWVEGFIVGWPVNNKGNEFTTIAPTSGANSQLSLADDAQGTNCIPVQVAYAAQQELTGGVAANIGKKILIRGNVETYFNVNGLKGTSAVVFLEAIPVTGISVSPTEKSIAVTETFTIEPTFTPADADDKRITWTSSAPTVASVNNGVVTGLKNGSAIITATTVDGGFTATTTVTVGSAEEEIRMADVIVLDSTTATSTAYVDWTCGGASGTHYAGKNATEYQTMQFTSKEAKASGIVNTSSVGYIREVQIVWNTNCQDRTLNIYGSNTALTLAGLHETATQDLIIGTISKGTTTFAVKGNYPYVGIRVASGGAAYLDQVTLVWGITRHDEEDVPLSSIALSDHELTLEAEATAELTVSYNPTNATNKGVTWSSTNTAVATVKDGTVTAITPGQAAIVATSTDGQKLTDTCMVTVTKKDIFRGRDIYYKISSLEDLHQNDTVIFVNEQYNRASAAFETYTYKKKNEKGELIEYTAGRIAPAELEIVRDADSIGCWGVDEIRLEYTAQGWRIYVTALEDDPYEEGQQIGVQQLLRATEINKIMITGEGNTYWNINFDQQGNASIVSQDPTAGSMQFNSSNKSFTTYTSAQLPLQIYRKKNQHTEPIPMQVEQVSDSKTATKFIRNGILYILRDGKTYNAQGRVVESKE